ncbi:Uncharacterised protein [Serratia marcescens]|uniref:N-ethylmaleimide reductase n=1 Tax=Serratia marcescens TaxID=615 RepID=A0A379Y6F5_SERMA|nr:Uncharacterised protein [Serratia marcescens]
MRLAPLTTLMGSQDDTPEATYLAAASVLNDIGAAYIHIAEADWDDAPGNAGGVQRIAASDLPRHADFTRANTRVNALKKRWPKAGRI